MDALDAAKAAYKKWQDEEEKPWKDKLATLEAAVAADNSAANQGALSAHKGQTKTDMENKGTPLKTAMDQKQTKWDTDEAKRVKDAEDEENAIREAEFKVFKDREVEEKRALDAATKELADWKKVRDAEMDDNLWMDYNNSVAEAEKFLTEAKARYDTVKAVFDKEKGLKDIRDAKKKKEDDLKALNDRAAARKAKSDYKSQEQAFNTAKAAYDGLNKKIADEQKIIDDYAKLTNPTAAQTTAKNNAETKKKNYIDNDLPGAKSDYTSKSNAFKTYREAQAQDDKYLLESKAFLDKMTLDAVEKRIVDINKRKGELTGQIE